MRALAAVGMALVLGGCAALPFETARSVATPAAVAVETSAEHAPRRSQQELLAAYWAERRAPRVLTASDFFTADFKAPSPTIGQNFPESSESEDQSLLHTDRLLRESAATREAVRAATRR
jgi:hypothetical protein